MPEKSLVILQARMSSKRFPGKVMQDVCGEPMIIRQINRISCANSVGKVIVATTKDESDDALSSLLLSKNIEIYRGEIDDVISRFVGILSKHQDSTVVRLTADCPLVMADLIDCMIEEFARIDCDYLSNTIVPTFPDGLDVEIFDRESLLRLSTLELSKSEKEHVTLGFHNKQNLFKIRNFLSRRDYSDLRWTVDYPQDLEFVRIVYSKFSGLENKFGFNEVLDLIEKNPTIKSSIPAIRRNEALRENS
jgi:spore coat polysaccharide biosynthesis protein SpsF